MARVLLVDDDDAVRGFARRALELEGHAVTEAVDGQDALERLEADKAAFDVVVTDVQMPRLDGIALAEAVARVAPGLPLVLMTGYAAQRERADLLGDAVSQVLLKPFTLSDFKIAVEKAIEKRAPSG